MDKVLEYCYRGIIRYLDGDVELFKKYVDKAIELNVNMCECEADMVKAKYMDQDVRLCTSCGKVVAGKEVVRRCLINSMRVS